MGIRLLNKYLRENAKQSIKITHLSELSGKKIAIDISIYLYKFLAEDALIENIYLMITIFRYYNIIPVFIFDGKPPVEKKELIKKRIQSKNEAKDEYNELKTKLEIESTMDNNEKQELINQMDDLKKKFVFVKKNDIENVKLLIESYGVSFYEANGEADELCAILAIKEKVWACLSEDMDMFVYGVPRILRYLSMINHNVVLYDLPKILIQLKMDENELREICVLSGTDYDMENSYSLYQVLDLFKKYKSYLTLGIENQENTFYEWLVKNTNGMNDLMKEKLLEIKKRFEIGGSVYLSDLKQKNKVMFKEKLEFLLRNNGGFLF